MEKLVKLLNALEDDDTIDGTHEFLSLDIPIVAEISQLAEELLITEGGKCHWDNIADLMVYGYQAFAVEKDGFGWLVGGISTQKGVITYG